MHEFLGAFMQISIQQTFIEKLVGIRIIQNIREALY